MSGKIAYSFLERAEKAPIIIQMQELHQFVSKEAGRLPNLRISAFLRAERKRVRKAEVKFYVAPPAVTDNNFLTRRVKHRRHKRQNNDCRH